MPLYCEVEILYCSDNWYNAAFITNKQKELYNLDEYRKQIFKEEMDKLKRTNLVSEEVYNKVNSAHEALYINLQKIKQQQSSTIIPPQQPKPVAQKKAPTPQEVRERNITWVLMIGVIFVLMAGLILATSSWSVLGNAAKTTLITLVAVLFFGISFFTDNTLKIKKTAFAFWVLGSLFLPVAVLSAGYFQLFGEWLSVTGGGKYLLGVIGASICIPVYAYSTLKYGNRLFAWLTLIAATLDVGFLIAAFNPPVDIFYFGIVLYNGVLVYTYAKGKIPEKYKVFLTEMPMFIQVNLFVSTFFMLTFFHNHQIYGFNLILTSIVYVFMVFAKGKKEYSYIFCGLLIYGIYQVVENTGLASIDFVLFSLAGFIFIGMEYFLKEQEALKKIFMYLSGFVSLCTFVFVNLKGVDLKTNHASFFMFISYCLIALNYTYLSYRTGKKVFAYLVSIFLLSAGHQSYKLIELSIPHYLYSLHMFVVSVVIFAGLYYKNHWEYTKSLKQSSGLFSLVLMLSSAFIAISETKWGVTSFIFLAFGISLYLVYKKTEFQIIKGFTSWCIPIAIGLSMFTTYGVISPHGDYSNVGWYKSIIHLAVSVLVLFMSSTVLGRVDKTLGKTFFWVSHILIPVAIMLLLESYSNNPILFVIPALIYLYSMGKVLSEHKSAFQVCIFLYASFTAGICSLFSSVELFKLPSEGYYYILPLSGGILAALWWAAKNEWKKRTLWYFLTISFIGIFAVSGSERLGMGGFICSIVSIALILFVLYKSRLSLLEVIPLLCVYPNIYHLYDSVLKHNNEKLLVMLLVLFFVLKYTGEYLNKKLYGLNSMENKMKSVKADWYSIYALLTLIAIQTTVQAIKISEWLGLIPSVLLVFLIYSQRNRVEQGKNRNVVNTLWMVALMLPYTKLLEILKPAAVINTELNILPLIAISIALSLKVWKGHEEIMRRVQLAVLLFISAILFKDILVYGYLADAFITGGLSLIALIVGMQYRIKSYFFVGMGTLLLNGLIQTKEFWGNVPWWGYLLIVGLLLIGIASLNEMQKGEKGKRLKLNKESIKDKFKGWR